MMSNWLCRLIVAGALVGIGIGCAAEEATPTPTPTGTPTATPVPLVATPTPTATPEPVVAKKTGGVFRYQVKKPLKHLDYFTSSGSTPYDGIASVYNGLVGCDPLATECIVTPELADGWEWRDDKTVVFHLRDGVKFHDGTPLTAGDVVFSFKLQVFPPKGYVTPQGGILHDVEDVVDEGERNVAFKLKGPSASFLNRLTVGYFQVAPRHVWERERHLRTVMVGTGPFKFVEVTPQLVVVLERNPDYFLKGLPYLDGREIIPITEEAAVDAALYIKRIDAVQVRSGITRDTIQVMERERPEIVIDKSPGSGFAHLAMVTTQEPWTNRRVRQAVVMSIDRQEIADVVGFEVSIGGAIQAPWGLSMEKLVETGFYGPIEPRRERARQILKEEGIQKGHPITLWTKPRADRSDIGEVLALQLNMHLPFTVTHRILEDAAFEERSEVTGELGMWVESMSWLVAEPDVGVSIFYTSFAPRNYWKSQDPRIDELFYKQAVESDVEKRKAIVNELDRVIIEDAAVAILWWPINYSIRQPYVKDWLAGSVTYARQTRAEYVWLDK